MSFGLYNAPASFQGYINKILAKKLDVFVIVYLDDILIYTDDQEQAHVDAVRWVLDILRNNSLFDNLKRCRFHKDKVRFLSYVVLAQGVKMEDDRIEAVKNWPEPKSVRDIQVFLGFANFYRRFIRGFSKIAGPLTSILRTANLIENSLTSVGVAEEDKVVGGGEFGGANGNSSKSQKSKKSKKSAKNPTKMTKSQKLTKSKSFTTSNVGATKFLTSEPRIAFTQLKKTFTEAPILRHFDPQCHIRIEIDPSGYAIGGVLS